MTDHASHAERLLVRVNVTCKGVLVALDERGAIVQLATAQRPDRQTTLAIEDFAGETLYLPARIVRTEPDAQPSVARREHYVSMEFFELPDDTAAAVRRLIDLHYTPRPSKVAPFVPRAQRRRLGLNQVTGGPHRTHAAYA